MNCKICKKELDRSKGDGYVYCAKCKKKISRAKLRVGKPGKCAICGVKIIPGWKYCQRCVP